MIKPFRIWLLRAKAECSLNLFEECEYSISRASYYAKTYIDDLNIAIMMNQMNTKRIIEKLKEEHVDVDNDSIDGYMKRISDS